MDVAELEIIDSAEIKDIYFDTDAAVERLLKEWNEHDTLVVATDFDSTIHDTEHTGSKHEQMIELLQACHKMGCKIIIFTCRNREDYDYIDEYCHKVGIIYDAINENLPETNFSLEGKVFYNIFFDDRAGLGQAYMIMVRTIEKRMQQIERGV